MRLRRTLLPTLLLALLPTVCLAVTVAPDEAISEGDDPRLDSRITYKANGATLAHVLAELARTTGVAMSAGNDQSDWTVYDRKVIVHVTNMKLADLMREIASIVRFRWSREGESGKWTYRLRQDKEQRREEESLRTSTEDAATGRFREKRENALSDMVNLGSLSPADARKLKTTDPWRYVLATDPLGRDVAEFLSSFPEARNAFIQGFEAAFPVSQLSTDLQATVRRIAESYDSLTRSIGIAEDHSDLLARFDKLQITMNRSRSGLGGDILAKSLLGCITIGMGANHFDVPLFDPSSAMGKALGTAIVDLQAGVPTEDVAKHLKQTMAQALKIKSDASPEPARDITSDSALRVPIRLFEVDVQATLTMTLQSLAINSKMNVVSDYFPGTAPVIVRGEKPLGEQLETIRFAFGSNWEKEGNTLRFRDKQWFKKRAWEVAEAWIQYWITRAKANDGLLLEDLAQIANLSDDQIDRTVMTNPRLTGYGASEAAAAANRQILRFYALLTDQQRDLLSKTGLSVSSLNDDQWAALQTAVATRGAAHAAAQKGSQAIRLTQSATGITEYKFSYHPDAGQGPVVFKLTSGIVYRPADETGLP